MTTPIFQSALDRGLSIHPLKQQSKEPHLPDWPNKATNNPVTISEWAFRFPKANYGAVADENFCILDIDNLEAFHGELGVKLPKTYKVATSRGLHLYFRHTERSRKLGNKGAIGVFDFQADHKYVVGEGSTHPSGHVYACIDSSPIIEIPDSLTDALERFVVQRKRERAKLGLKAGDRQDMLNYAGSIYTAEISEDEMLEKLIERNEAESEELLSVGDLQRMVQSAFKKWEHATPSPTLLVGAPKLDGPDETCTGEDYVLGPAATAKFEGWFPLGEVSLIAGSSGAGKTTWALQMLDAQSRGESFLGHQSFALPYIMVMQDRSEFAMRRTFRRLEIGVDQVPWRVLPKGSKKRDPGAVLEELYLAEAVKPRVVFVEGLDIWIPENFKMDIVSDVIQSLQAVAQKYNFAVISTLGSPKRAKKDQYEAPRDAVYGSSVFARMTETIVKVTEDYETGERNVLVMPRQEASERFRMVMQDGRVVVRTGITTNITPTVHHTKRDAFLAWLTPESTWEQAQERFGISRRTFFNWKESAPKEGCDMQPDNRCTSEFVDG